MAKVLLFASNSHFRGFASKIKKEIPKTSKFLLVFALALDWIFSGYPQIFNPSTLFRTGFPPKIKEARAA